MVNFGVVMADIMKKMGYMEKEIGRLRHHVSVLSKRNHWLELEAKEKDEEKEEVAEENAKVAEVAAGKDAVAAEVTLTEITEAEESVVGSGSSVMELDRSVEELSSRISDEDVLVDEKIVPLKVYDLEEKRRLSRELRALGVPARLRGQGAGGRSMGPIRGRGQNFVFGSEVSRGRRQFRERG
ncbi:hypothetical protein B9Z19DRAFT_1132208 [Tuber borchii]|uniref:Uncharacterized protein n=1 Tax=Tuber borchii TaxID=42251 RepID=A0A2T6ZHF3_TUBBO|nr:hypothetical protein B9Z19DRAFT_1132208 [Tuber borchii]